MTTGSIVFRRRRMNEFHSPSAACDKGQPGEGFCCHKTDAAGTCCHGDSSSVAHVIPGRQAGGNGAETTVASSRMQATASGWARDSAGHVSILARVWRASRGPETMVAAGIHFRHQTTPVLLLRGAIRGANAVGRLAT